MPCPTLALASSAFARLLRPLALVGFQLAASTACAQQQQEQQPAAAEASDLRAFLTQASETLQWEVPFEPLHIAGPIYYVGTTGLGSYLIATQEGHILLNSGMPSSGPLIIHSIEELGFKPGDVQLIINGHAHLDHAGAFAYLKERTGAEVAIMREDAQAIRDGGQDDFFYGAATDVMGFPPCAVDRVLRDQDTLKMGDVLLTAHHTPGHTRGATTWVAHIVHEGRALVVVWPEGVGINPGYQVAVDPSYPGINGDYRRTFHTLEMLQPDIFLAGHGNFFGFLDKQQRAAAEGLEAWINPDEYRRFISAKRRVFEDQVEREIAAAESAGE